MRFQNALAPLSATIVRNPLGDYTGDSVVDARDYVIWRRSLGSITQLAADGNQNNRIDDGDYGVWRAYFGQTAAAATASGASLSAPVPEPAAWMLWAFGGVKFLSLCKRAGLRALGAR